MEKDKIKNVLKWIVLLPLFTAIIIIANYFIDFFQKFLTVGCVSNSWLNCSQLGQPGFFSNIWLDIAIMFIALQSCLEFMDRRYFKSAFVALLIWRVLTLIVLLINYSYSSDLTSIEVFVPFLPTILVFGYVGYRIFYENEPIVYFRS